MGKTGPDDLDLRRFDALVRRGRAALRADAPPCARRRRTSRRNS
ncbi:hypothetical protein [Actinomadura nitritigenes]|nr:hypothetical protein [Actinomadura nitritigenes]